MKSNIFKNPIPYKNQICKFYNFALAKNRVLGVSPNKAILVKSLGWGPTPDACYIAHISSRIVLEPNQLYSPHKLKQQKAGNRSTACL